MSSLDRLKKRAIASQATTEREILVPLDKIRFDPSQPRKAFHTLDGRVAEKDEQYIAELAASIKEQELIQAITVQEMQDGTYLVVVGECRTRAHLLLKVPTIRAIVRNDLNNPALRLLYQLSENVNRQDLSDDELAGSILKLMEGDDKAGVPKMNQVQIAAKLGKSEGWVSRFVKFGDEEQQRVWVKSGIADTVEKVYRLSILPKAAQIEVIRRASLPEGDPERLETPLKRTVIDDLAKEAKLGKRVDPTLTLVTLPAAPAVALATQTKSNDPVTPGSGAEAITEAIRQAALDGKAKSNDGAAVKTNAVNEVLGVGSYKLPETDREALLGSKPVDTGTGSIKGTGNVQAPVNCRVSLRNIEALLAALKYDEIIFGQALGVRCEVTIPGELAKIIANKLVGVVVDDQEIPAIMQQELSKLV